MRGIIGAGQSLMVTNSNACRLNSSCLCSSHVRTLFPFHNCKSSSTNGLRYTSMSLPGCLGPWMRTGIIMNVRFMHIQGGRLYIHRVTGQVLRLLLCSPKGLMPSALKANHTFLASPANSSLYFLSIFLHRDPSAGTLNFPSFLRSSLCHRINLACSSFLNRGFNRGIIGAYHITLAGIFFLGRDTSPTYLLFQTLLPLFWTLTCMI